MKVPSISTLPEEEGKEAVTPSMSRKSSYNLRPSELLKKRLSPTTMKKVCRQSSTPTPRKSTRMRQRVLANFTDGSVTPMNGNEDDTTATTLLDIPEKNGGELTVKSNDDHTQLMNLSLTNIEVQVPSTPAQVSFTLSQPSFTPVKGNEDNNTQLMNTSVKNIEEEPIPSTRASFTISRPVVTFTTNDKLSNPKGRQSKRKPSILVQTPKNKLATSKIPRKTLGTFRNNNHKVSVAVVPPRVTKRNSVNNTKKSLVTVRKSVNNTKKSIVTVRKSTNRQPLGELKGYMRPTLSSQAKMIKKDTLKPERPVTTTLPTPKKSVRSRSAATMGQRSACKTKFYGKTIRPKK